MRAWPLPHYCYHPGLSIPASCRICLVEVEGLPKLVPSCQTPIRDGMVVHANSTKAIANQKQVMEYLLINHPLDCPVCDQAGECLLQDYSYEYGRSQSRFEEDKAKKPEEGRRRQRAALRRPVHHVHALRAVHARGERHERAVRRGPRAQGRDRDLPGPAAQQQAGGQRRRPLPGRGAARQGFPVQAARLAAQARRRRSARSTPAARTSTSHHNEGVIYRVKPRYNADVNQWWISDDTRYSYKPVHDEKRLNAAARDAVRHAGRHAASATRSKTRTRGLTQRRRQERPRQPVRAALADDGVRGGVAARQGASARSTRRRCSCSAPCRRPGRTRSSRTRQRASRRSRSRPRRCPTPPASAA